MLSKSVVRDVSPPRCHLLGQCVVFDGVRDGVSILNVHIDGVKVTTALIKTFFSALQSY